MIHYQDARTAIEIDGRVVAVLPRPLHDFDRATELKRLFPENKGWTHFRYAVHQVLESHEAREILATAAVIALERELAECD